MGGRFSLFVLDPSSHREMSELSYHAAKAGACSMWWVDGLGAARYVPRVSVGSPRKLEEVLQERYVAGLPAVFMSPVRGGVPDVLFGVLLDGLREKGGVSCVSGWRIGQPEGRDPRTGQEMRRCDPVGLDKPEEADFAEAGSPWAAMPEDVAKCLSAIGLSVLRRGGVPLFQAFMNMSVRLWSVPLYGFQRGKPGSASMRVSIPFPLSVRFGMSEAPMVLPESRGVELDSNDLPVLPVCFLTHNRTAVACHCLDALCKRMKYSGAIRWIICDDRSDPGHVEALEHVLKSNGVSDFVVKRTDEGAWGLGASMNNGLREAFSVSDVVLTSEDDFLMRRDFDITGMVGMVRQHDIAGIRLAHLETQIGGSGGSTRMASSAFPGYFMAVGGRNRLSRHRFVFNNQVMLRHKRVYDAIGEYRENVNTDVAEEEMTLAYNTRFNEGRDGRCVVLYPSSLRTNTLDNGLFTHIGVSTVNHGYVPPHEFSSINCPEADRRARDVVHGLPKGE